MKKLYYGGTILTMEDDLYAEALLVEDKRILAVGSKEELTQGLENEEIQEIDLQGKTLMPAFIDAHSHFSQVATSFLQVSLDGAASAAEIKNRIQKFIEENDLQSGDWITAKDYDHNLLGGKHLTLAELNDITLEYALVIQHKSGHMGLFNSLALEKLEITVDTPDPQGGMFGKDENGLTGYVEENAYFTLLKQMPLPGMGALMSSYKKAQDLYASYGITTMQDGMVVKEMLPLYELIQMTELLKLDLVAFPDVSTFLSGKEMCGLALKKYDGHLKIGGLKIFLDGSPQGRTAWMEKPYEGETEYCGYGTMTDEQVEEAFLTAGRENLQILAHCNGDAAAAQYLRCLEKAMKKEPQLKEIRTVMIHSQFLRPDQLPKVKELGVIPSFFVAHVYHWGDVHVKNMGLERAKKMSPAASALKEEICFTFHQDSPVIEPDMFETIWCAVKRETSSGVILGEDERISVLDALKAVTVNAAWQYYDEKEKGSLAAGKKADYIILDKNPLEVEIDELKKIQILATVKDGSLVYSDFEGSCK